MHKNASRLGELNQIIQQLGLSDSSSPHLNGVNSPIRVSRTASVGSDKSMTTTATLYRNGKLVVEVDTDCDDLMHGLRGRVLVVARDGDGNASGATNVLHCTTRGGVWDPSTPSSGKDVFYLQFPEDVARRAVSLDIYQANGGSLGTALNNILQVGNVVLAVLGAAE